MHTVIMVLMQSSIEMINTLHRVSHSVFNGGEPPRLK